MKRIPILTVAALFAAMFFVSCKNSGGSDIPVPKDASVVFYVNTSSLTSKLSWEEIKQSGWFKENYERERDSFTKKIMDNPEASGVDMKGDFAFFMKKQGRGGLAVVEGKIKSTSDFENMLKKSHQGENIKVEKDGDLNYVVADENLISWNKSTFVIMSDMNMPAMDIPFGEEEAQYQEPFKFSTDSMKLFTKQLLSLKGDDLLNNDDRFSDMLKQEGDMHLWMNYDSFLGEMGSLMSMFKFGDLLKGNAAALTINFADGRIEARSRQYYGDELSKLMKNYKPRNVDAALINRIPSQNVIGAMAFNFDSAWLKEFFKSIGVDGMINGYLGKVDLSLDEVISATGGQFMMSVSDLTIQNKTTTYPPFYEGGEPYTSTRPEPDFSFLVAASVGNKSTFDKLMDMARQNMEGADTSISWKSNNEWFAASNKPETVDRFLAGGNNNVPFAGKISGHPYGLYIDLQKIFTAARSTDSTSLQIASQYWKEIVSTGGEFKDNMMTADFVIHMMDQKTNSLKQMNQFMQKMYESEKAKRPSEDELVDSEDDLVDYMEPASEKTKVPPTEPVSFQ